MRTAFILTLLAILPGTRASAQGMSLAAIQEINERAYEIYTDDFGRADSLFTLAAETAADEGWASEEAAARKNRGIVFYLTGNYDAALAEYQAALSQFEGLEDAGGQAAVLVEMGNFFKKRGETDRAVDMLERAGKLAEEAGDLRLLSNSIDIHARIKQDAGDIDGAERMYYGVLELRRKIKDTVGLSYVFDNLGAIQTLRGNFERSLAYLDSTITIREVLGDRQGIAIAINNQGEALLAAADTAAAIPYLERSLAMSSTIGFTDLRQWTMGLLGEAYEANGNPRRALQLQRQVQEIKDSLYSESTTARVAEMQEKYESEKREAELQLRESQLNSRTAWLIAAMLGAVLLFALLMFRSRAQRQKREQLRVEGENRLRDDRLRISRDLHDNLGAELSIVASNLGRLDHKLPGQGLAPITEQVRYAMEQMRETIWAVRLEGATWADLIARLRVFAEKLPHDNIKITLFEGMANERLEPHRVLNLYRFGQEALANAVKHARASEIRMHARPHQFHVEDNGGGFDPEAEMGGFGMASMRERAKEMEMMLFVDSSAERGTQVILKF